MKIIVTDLSELQALKQAAQAGEQKKLGQQPPRTGSIRKEAPALLGSPERLDSYALPLSPLRARDRAALTDWFQRSDMSDLESDIAQMLLRLFPEPHWEENPFEFLREFL